MKIFVFRRLAFSLMLIGCVFSARPDSVTANGWTPDNGDGTFTNPLMWGDWPDPDVIRVGDDFYFVSTSMHYVPGCPIAKSKDLVNWQMAGYAVPRYDEDPRYDMKGGSLYLNGSWASTIRNHNGLFYVGFCTPYGQGTGKGHFSICTATNVSGPWTRTIFPEYLYDPGLLFDDDGKVYVAHGQGTLYVTELNADARSVKVGQKEVFHNNPSYPYLEGSHFYKINGKYYILGSTGGSGGREVCLRSDNVYGPYESKVVINDKSTYPPNGLHQGGMVQLRNGDWWFIIMQDRGPIGRVPNLEPVTWVDGWPMIGKDGKGVVTFKKPNVGGNFPVAVPATSDEFNSPSLGLQWQWNHNPDNANWSLAERPGYLRLHAGKASDLKHARNTLTQRVQGPASEGTVEMDLRGLKDGDVAGFGVFQFPYAYVAVRQEGGVRKIVMVNDNKIIATVDNFTGDTVWFKAAATSKGFKAAFAYSTDGKNFIDLGNTLNMGLGLSWTANRFALFNFSTTDSGVGGVADFNYCHVSMTNTIQASAASSAFTLDASSEQSDNAAANAMDGNPDTRWCAETDLSGQWLQIDLGQPRAVAKADILWEFSSSDYHATVEGSDDGEKWKPLPGTFRFVRITVTAMPDKKWASIREVKLIGPDGKEIAFPTAEKSSKPTVAVKQFVHPDRIRYDGHCLTIDGKDTGELPRDCASNMIEFIGEST